MIKLKNLATLSILIILSFSYALPTAYVSASLGTPALSTDSGHIGDTIIVSGGPFNVTSGTPIDIYWNTSTGSRDHLLNTTSGSIDGSYTVQVIIPEDSAGTYFIWVKDTATGITERSEAFTLLEAESPQEKNKVPSYDIQGNTFTGEDSPDQNTLKKTKHPKLESILEQLAESEFPANFEKLSQEHMISIENGSDIQVVIELTHNASRDDIKLLEERGAIVETTFRHLVQICIPITRLTTLLDIPAVQYIKSPSKPSPAVVSEGVYVINADDSQDFGYTGSDVKVAIIDVGFDVTNSEISGNIVEAKSFMTPPDITGGGEPHGTACAEIVLDVAPDALLYLYQVSTEVEFLNAVQYAIDQGVEIISVSLGWEDRPTDGTGILCEIVDDAYSQGVFVVVAAGNEAANHWEGVYQDDDLDDYHNFLGADETNQFYATEGTIISLTLNWDDWPFSDQDFDLLLYDDSMALIGSSVNYQGGSQSPTEYIGIYAPYSGNYHIVIEKYDATRNVKFDLYIGNSNLEYVVSSSSLCDPGTAVGAFTIGATDYTNDTLASYSSRGPTNDGRLKPDVSAPTRVSTSAYGYEAFTGTSAATPHVAGAAAILLSYNGTYSVDDLKAILEDTALDLGELGPDNLFGYGRIRLEFSLGREEDVIIIPIVNTSVTLDGVIQNDEWQDATNLTFQTNSVFFIKFCTDENALYYSLNVLEDTTYHALDQIYLYLDTAHDEGSSPDEDDYMFHVSRDGDGYIGTYEDGSWSRYNPSWFEWSVVSTSEGWSVEAKIPISGVFEGLIQGIRIRHNDFISDYDYYSSIFPFQATAYVPSTWGDAVFVNYTSDDGSPMDAVQLTLNSPYSAVIIPAGDVDYYKFSANSNRIYIIETQGSTDTYLTLYSTDGVTILDEDDDSGEGLNAYLNWTCPSSGTYYVEVSGYDDFETGPYNITIIIREPLILLVSPSHGIVGEAITAFGSQATAGGTVEIYWDIASGVNAWLLNTTTGNPDGSYTLQITIPETSYGDHYVWVKDVSTGRMVSISFTVQEPLILLVSPSHGIVGEAITAFGSQATAGGTVEIYWDIASGVNAWLLNTTTGNPDGSYILQITIPETSYGDHYVWVKDVSTGRMVYVNFTVNAAFGVIIDKASVSDDRVDMGTTQAVSLHGIWMENSSDVTTGTFYVNEVAYTVNTTGWATFEVSRGDVGQLNWTVTGVQCGDVTSFSQTAADPAIIWDRVEVIDGGASPERVGPLENSTVWFKARYSYDSTVVDDAAGQLSVNGTSCVWSEAGERWEMIVSRREAGNVTYVVSDVSEVAYGLSGFTDIAGPVSVFFTGEWRASLSVDVAGSSAGLVLGLDEEATVGFDAEVGDTLVSPAPPSGVSAYFHYPDNPSSQVDLRKLSTSLLPVEYPAGWTLKVQTIGVSGDASLDWSSSEFDAIPVNYTVTLDTPSGGVDMRSGDSYGWVADADTTYTFMISITSEVEFTLELNIGWNMVSIPVVPEDHSAASVLSDVSFFQLVTWSGTGYVTASDFEAGRGYWLLVLEDVNVTVSGSPVDSLNLNLSAGWNMVGGTYDEVQADDVFPGFYQLVTWTGTGYIPATVFEPGRGYWALVLSNTQIELNPN